MEALEYKGAWDAVTSYVINDIVTHSNSTYIAKAASLNDVPPSASWGLIAGPVAFPVVTSGAAYIESTQAADDAVRMNASNVAGGLQLTAGGVAAFGAGAGNISIDSLQSTYVSGAGSFSLLRNTAAAGLAAIHANGATGVAEVRSSGTGADAVRIRNLDAAGGIAIDAGTNGIDAATTGTIALHGNSASAASSFTSNHRLTLQGAGALGNAVIVEASNAAGGLNFISGTGGVSATSTGQMAFQPSIANTSGFFVNPTAGGFRFHSQGTGANGKSSIVSDGNSATDDLLIETASGTGQMHLRSIGNGNTSMWLECTQGGLELDSVKSSSWVTSGAGGDLTLQSTQGVLRLYNGGGGGGQVYVHSGAGPANVGVLIESESAMRLESANAGDIVLDALSGQVILDGGIAAADAIKIAATNTAGGIDVDAGTGGIDIRTTGALNVVPTLSSIINVFGVDQDLVLQAQGGGTAQQVLVTSYGTGTDAIRLNSVGGIRADAGVQGVTLDTSGRISIDSTGNSTSNITVTNAAGKLAIQCNGTSGADDLLVHANGTGGQMRLISEGSVDLLGGGAVADAVKIQATNAAGGVDVDAGSAGMTTDSTGSLTFTSTKAADTSALSFVASDTGSGINFGVGASALKMTYSGGRGAAMKMTGAGTNQISWPVVDTDTWSLTNGGEVKFVSTAGQFECDAGIAAADAIKLTASHTAGGVDINAGTGGVDIATTGGIALHSATAASIQVTGAAQNVTFNTDGTASKGDNGAAWDVISDMRVKRDISDVAPTESLELLRQLRVKRFKFDQEYIQDCVEKIGLIAQEVAEVIPEAVTCHEAHGFSDFRTLSIDRILFHMLNVLSKCRKITFK